MTHPLIDKLLQHGLPLLNAGNFDAFATANRDVVLFFTQDPRQFPESSDVAAILPELLTVFSGRLVAALIDRGIERELQARYRFGSWPALVFLRRGEYLGAIEQMRDWPEYLALIERILASEPSAPPPFDLDRVCAPLH